MTLACSGGVPRRSNSAWRSATRSSNVVHDVRMLPIYRYEAGPSAASCNLELAIVKRAFKLALRAKEVHYVPHIPMATLHNARAGFFSHDQFEAVRTALPATPVGSRACVISPAGDAGKSSR
jgi:hypothetical protein